MAVHGFDQQGARRIVDAVRRIERQSHSGPLKRRRGPREGGGRAWYCVARVNDATGVGAGDSSYDVDEIIRWGPPGTAEPEVSGGDIDGSDVKNTHGFVLDDDALVSLWRTIDTNGDEFWDSVQGDCPA